MRKYINITTEPEIRKGKRGTSFRFRIPAHHGKPESKSPWRKAKGKKKGEITKEAEAYRQELEDEINDWRSKSDITLGAYAREWHEQRTDEINELSFEREGQIITEIEKSDLGHIAIAEIEPDDIEKQKKKNSAAGWSKDKQRRWVQKVKQITKEAAGRRAIKYDPGTPVKEVKSKSKERRAVPAIIIADMLDVLDAREKTGKTAALRIAIGTGYRRGEILGLQWGDIDLLHKTIDLQRQLDAKGKLKPPKYNSKGIMPIDADLAEWLQEWKDIYTTRYGISGINKAPVCCNENGGYLVPSNFDRWRRLFFVENKWGTFEQVEKIQDAKGDTRYHRTGFEGYTLHEIRHYLATALLGSGADLKSTQNIMRHKRITTTEGYIHEIPENVKNAMQGIEKEQQRGKGALEYLTETRGGMRRSDEEQAEYYAEHLEEIPQD